MRAVNQMGVAIQMPAGSPKADVIQTTVLIRKEDEIRRTGVLIRKTGVSRRDGRISTASRNHVNRIRADLYKALSKRQAASKTPAILKK